MPPSLKRQVVDDGRTLKLWVREPSWKIRFVQLTTMVTVVFGAIVTFATFGLGALLAILWGPMLVALWGWALWAPTQHRLGNIGRNGLTIPGPWPKRVRPQRVIVTGELGRKCAVWIGDRLLLEREMDAKDGWTPRGLSWFVDQISRRMGVPLEDHRPRDAWHRWEDDPVFRACVTFDNELEDCQSEFTDFYRLPPVPLRVEVDHHGMRLEVQRGMLERPSVVQMGLDTLTNGESTVPLAEIRRVAWFARKSDMGETYGELHVLTAGQWVRVFSTPRQAPLQAWAPRLTWLVNEISARADDARRRTPVHTGDRSEVPDALRAMAVKSTRHR